MTTPQSFRPMAEFNPSEPALLHDLLNNEIFAWDGSASHWREHARPDTVQGAVAWDGLQIDGWCEPLGG